MSLAVEIERIVVITDTGSTDKVNLTFKLPGSLKAYTFEPLTSTFEASPGYGVDYCRTNFPGVPIDVISIKDGRR